MSKLGSHAIIIGAGIGGLIAARILADRYDRVTILERDTIPQTAEPRRGVPHGKHAHGLLARGREVLEELFPGLTDGLIAAGAVAVDTLGDSRWFNHGVYLARDRSGLRSILLTRPLLETHLRQHLLVGHAVSIREHASVQDLVADEGNRRVVGVRLAPGVGGVFDEDLKADLVIDASGRHSHSAKWLEALGYSAPGEECVDVGITYATRILRRRPGDLGGASAALVGADQPGWRYGVALAIEGDRWIVTQGGYFGDMPTPGAAGFLEFARSLAAPDIAELLTEAEPLNDTMQFGFPASRRRRYERLARFPEGYLVFGDALCSFNPIYGQGMTAAALQGLALRNCLGRGRTALARQFFTEAASIIDTPWQIAVGNDLRHPRLEHTQSLGGRFLNWYVAKLHRAAAGDPSLGSAFLRVANLMDAPTKLFSPLNILKIVRGNVRVGQLTDRPIPQALGGLLPEGKGSHR